MRQRRDRVLHGVAALTSATGIAALADAEFPALQLPLYPGQSKHLPHSQADRTWGTPTISFPTPSLAGPVVSQGGSHATHLAPVFKSLTLRYSTGLVTLNLSIVVMIIAGVVRKKRRMKRTTLITRQRIHQMKPLMERCSLRRGEKGIHCDGYIGKKSRSGASGAYCSPACINSTWSVIPRLFPSKSSQTFSSARLGFSWKYSFSYQRNK